MLTRTLGLGTFPYIRGNLRTERNRVQVRDARLRRAFLTSLHPDVGGLDDAAPQDQLVGQELAELGGRADFDTGAEVGKALTCLRLCKGIAACHVELVDDY